ncbi:MAG: cytochrome b/b6 domain-containing protein [Rhodospirillales bacterium]|nr:cytochrome b/b6 domain-containing protein [Rhodospirillales bacterium]
MTDEDHTPPPLPRSDAMTAALHWGLVAVVLVSLGSGLRIAADAPDAALPQALSGVLPQGEVVVWHLWSSVAVTFIAVAYVAYVVHAGLGGRLALDAARLRAIAGGDRTGRWQAIGVMGHWFAFALVAGMAATGGLLYVEVAALPHEALAGLHRMLAWGFVAHAVIHVAIQAVLGPRQLAKMFAPRLAYGSAAGVALLTSGGAIAMVFVLDEAAMTTLPVTRVEAGLAPVIDGYFDDAAWTGAEAVTLRTVRGRNLPGGEVPVTVRAVHDGQTAYFSFEWPDPTRSQKHLPLIKGEMGWFLAGSDDHERRDENDFHEDMLAVMLARSPRPGGGAAHLGPTPAGAPGSPNQRGLHFTTDGSVVDVWQWRSVRTNPMGRMDDTYFGPPADPAGTKGAEAAYVTGHGTDPEAGGGYEDNHIALGDGRVRPLYLPRTPFLLARLGRFDLDPGASDAGEWWLAKADTVPYGEPLDARYPIGTVLPSVVVEGPFQGDRGDVRALGRWHDGRWRLEASRRLKTGSEFDLPIATGIHLWVAAFDHSQTRHSQHLHPLRLAVEE